MNIVGCATNERIHTGLATVNLGDIKLCPPIILAPMAGVTTATFRRICKQYGATLTISEMLHAQLFVNGQIGNKPRFYPGELRSVQLYGIEPGVMAIAAKRLIEEHGVVHIDLNFGCPAPKIIKKGGGAAIPADTRRLESIATAVVNVAQNARVPVTAKMRLGCFGRFTYPDAGRILQQSGVSAITMHARLAEERYTNGAARASWHHIRHLRQQSGIPIFGNGDVFTANDAIEMERETDADGIVIGRGALGRPWLFADIHRAFGSADGYNQTFDKTLYNNLTSIPSFGVVRDTMIAHFQEEIADRIEHEKMTEMDALCTMRKWIAWYWQGYTGISQEWITRLREADNFGSFQREAMAFDGYSVGVDTQRIISERGKTG